MNARFSRVVPLLLLALPLAGRAFDRSGPRAILYADPNFRGERIVLEAGAGIADLREFRFESGQKVNDKVSSIRVEGGAHLLVYADPEYTGDRLELDADAPDLRHLPRRSGGSWDDCISAVRVMAKAGPPRRDDDHRRRPEPDFRGPPEDEVIYRAYRELLGREPDADGLRHYRRVMREEHWDGEAVRRDIRAASEFRNREAGMVIRRAYMELLGRAPDPSGYENYRRRIVDEGWSEERVREALRRSDEFRQRQERLRHH